MKLEKIMGSIVGAVESMTPRGLLLLTAAAGLLAFGLFYLVLSNVSPGKSAESVPDTAMVKVVAAKRDIPVRTELKEEMLHVVELPQSVVPGDAIKDVATVVLSLIHI